MIKVSVMYPNKPGARFDDVYYRDRHMPLVKKLMGDKCRYYTVDKGLAGDVPGKPPTYIAMCHIFCDSARHFRQASVLTPARSSATFPTTRTCRPCCRSAKSSSRKAEPRPHSRRRKQQAAAGHGSLGLFRLRT